MYRRRLWRRSSKKNGQKRRAGGGDNAKTLKKEKRYIDIQGSPHPRDVGGVTQVVTLSERVDSVFFGGCDVRNTPPQKMADWFF